MIPVLGSQPAGDVSHKPGGIGCHYFPPGLQLPSQPLRGLLPISLLGKRWVWTVCLRLLPDSVAARDCDLNPGPTAPESSTLTIRLPSHPILYCMNEWMFDFLFSGCPSICACVYNCRRLRVLYVLALMWKSDISRVTECIYMLYMYCEINPLILVNVILCFYGIFIETFIIKNVKC